MVHILLFLSALLFLVPDALHACSCLAPGPPMEEFEEADAVFAGRVTSVNRHLRDDSPVNIATVVVERAWKAPDLDTLIVVTAEDGSECGFGFHEGRRYLVYAYRLGGGDTLGTNICTRTARLEEAGEDIMELSANARHTIWRISANTGITSISNPGWAPGANIGAGAEYFFTANIAAGANVMYHYLRYNRGDSFPAYLEPYEPSLDLFSAYATLRYEVDVAPFQLHVMAGMGYARFMPAIGVMWGAGSNPSSFAARETVVSFVGGVGARYPLGRHLALLAEVPMMVNVDAITSQYIFPVQIGLSFAY